MGLAKVAVASVAVGVTFLAGYSEGTRAGLRQGFKKGWSVGWDNCAGTVDIILKEAFKNAAKQSEGK